MAGHSKVVFYTDLERGDPVDVQRVGELGARDLADMLGYLSSHRAVDEGPGVGIRAAVIDGLEVRAQSSPNMTVQVLVGMGITPASGSSGVVGSPPATSTDSNVQLVNKRNASAAVAINAAPVSGVRYDLIEIAPAVASPDTVEVDETRTIDLWDVVLKRFLPSGSPRIKMRHGEGEVFYTAGSSGSAPAPTTTPGRIPIAVVRVLAGATSITAADVFDARVFLSELDGGGGHASWIRTEEVVVDFPASGVNDRLTSINTEVCARGVRGAFKTDTVFDLSGTGVLTDASWSDYASYVGWAYLYVVTQDDAGLRLSRAHVTTDITGDFSHIGVLVYSKVAPSLVNGSLAPSGAIRTPVNTGNTTCTPGGSGKAVCIGALYHDTGVIKHGLRMLGGNARFGCNDSLLQSLATGSWTHTGVGAAATTQTTAMQANFTPASNPKGPLSFDLLLDVAIIHATPPSGGACEMRMKLYEFVTGAAALGPLIGWQNTVDASGGAANYDRTMEFLNVQVSRIPTTRGSVAGGIKLVCEAIAGTTHQVGIHSTTPVPKLSGYRWPQGPVVA